MARKKAELGGVRKDRLAPPRRTTRWTSADDYLEALARRRTARHERERKEGPRTEPEVPRFGLSTLPFLALMAALAVLTLGIMIAAWPGSQPAAKRQQEVAERQPGTAPKGWLQEAEKEFH